MKPLTAPWGGFRAYLLRGPYGQALGEQADDVAPGPLCVPQELPAWKQAHNKSHTQVRARVEHVFARMKTWKILRDCRLKGDGVHHAVLGIAHLHHLALAG